MGSHDIAHCDNIMCESHNKCYRYLMHLEVIEKDITFVSYIMENKICDKCDMFWEVKNNTKKGE